MKYFKSGAMVIGVLAAFAAACFIATISIGGLIMAHAYAAQNMIWLLLPLVAIDCFVLGVFWEFMGAAEDYDDIY